MKHWFIDEPLAVWQRGVWWRWRCLCGAVGPYRNTRGELNRSKRKHKEETR